MDYELAKELKDKGFPEGGDEEGHSLSELIEACGYGFRSLSLHSDGRWIAKAGKRSGGFLKHASSPEEAVAKLWLKLNG